MTLDFKKECPQCHEITGEYHLMMADCDKCVGNYRNREAPEKYTEHTLGILVLNPKWVAYQEQHARH